MKLLRKIFTGFLLLAMVYAPAANALSVNTSVGIQNYMRYNAGSIEPIQAAYHFGSNTTPWDEGHFTDLYAATLAVTGVITGDLDMNGHDILKVDQIVGNTSLPVNIGDAGATSHTFNTNDDLFVSGRLEVDGISYFDNLLTLTNGDTISNAVAGKITLTGAGGAVNKEDLLFDFETTANEIALTSSTGVTKLTASAMAVYMNGMDNNNANITNVGDIALATLSPDTNNIGVTIGGNTFQIGDGTYVWQHAPMVGIEGALEVDGVTWFDGMVGATSYTATAGNLWAVTNTPASASTANIMVLTGAGGNWDAGTSVLSLVSNDNDLRPLTASNGATEIFSVGRDGLITTDTSLNLTGGGDIATTSNGTIRLMPNGTGITQVGDAGSTSRSLVANDDLFVSGKLEVDGATYLDGGLGVTGAITATQGIATGANYAFSPNSGITSLRWSTAQAVPTVMYAVGDTPKSFVFTTQGNVAKDHDHAAQPNPTIFIHSNTDPDTANTEWGGLVFSGSGAGGGTFDITTGGNNNIKLLAGGTGFTQVGTGTANKVTASNDDLFVAGEFEVDGTAFIDAVATFANNATINNNFYLRLGTTYATSNLFLKSTAQTPDALWLGLESDSLNLLIGKTDQYSADYAHALSSNPTVFVHSSTAGATTTAEWGSYAFTGTGSGGGTFDFNTGGSAGVSDIRFLLSGVESMRLTGYGGLVYTPSTTLNITAAGGLAANQLDAHVRVQGNGGAIDITANPQIADGTDGQRLLIQGDNDTNTLKLDDGTGLALSGGVSFTLGKGDMIQLVYDSGDDLWYETNRSDN